MKMPKSLKSAIPRTFVLSAVVVLMISMSLVPARAEDKPMQLRVKALGDTTIPQGVSFRFQGSVFNPNDQASRVTISFTLHRVGADDAS
jgi:hypothetical protein